jgi:hypothetical protein
MEMKKFVKEKALYRNHVEEMLVNRGIKNRVPMLVWLRSQKQLAVDANTKRVEKAELEMSILEEMIEDEPGSVNITGGGDVT